MINQLKNRKNQGINPLFLNVSKTILSRQSIFKKLQPKQNKLPQKNQLGSNILTEQQIKKSVAYDRQSYRLQMLKQKNIIDKLAHQNKIEEMDQQIQIQKQNIYELKIVIWQLKNQLMELEDLLQQEEAQHNNYIYDEQEQSISEQVTEHQMNNFQNCKSQILEQNSKQQVYNNNIFNKHVQQNHYHSELRIRN